MKPKGRRGNWFLQLFTLLPPPPSFPCGKLASCIVASIEAGEIGFYKFAFSKLAYLILPESSGLLDSGGGHKTDCQINDALKCSPVRLHEFCQMAKLA